MVLIGLLAAAPPLTPDGDEARSWAEQELADPVYAAAEPTPLDRIAQAIGEFLSRLFNPEIPAAFGPSLAVIAAVVVGILILVAFLVWGMPRIVRRAPGRDAALFGTDDVRSAAELRRDAASHAERGEWADAIIVRVRAMARALAERGIVDTPPGATVHAFSRAASRPFPASAGDLERVADAFDDVRYLRRPGTPELYELVATADDALAAARPLVTDEVPA